MARQKQSLHKVAIKLKISSPHRKVHIKITSQILIKLTQNKLAVQA